MLLPLSVQTELSLRCFLGCKFPGVSLRPSSVVAVSVFVSFLFLVLAARNNGFSSPPHPLDVLLVISRLLSPSRAGSRGRSTEDFTEIAAQAVLGVGLFAQSKT